MISMRNVFRIFVDDLRLGLHSPISTLILVGLILLPVMSAWLNTAASWDPYNNTQGLKVAVVNDDEGYKGDLLPLRVNTGDSVVSSLRANDSFSWEFVDNDTAMEGVRSGRYYAALVIPSSFSADLMSLFSPNVEHSSIIYYTNEKENPIAPRITDAGAGVIQESIREQFTSTVSEVALSLSSDLVDFSQSDQLASYIERMGNSIDTASSDIHDAADRIRSFSQVMGATRSLVDSSASVMDSASDSSTRMQNAISSSEDSLSSTASSLEGSVDAVSQALSKSAESFDSLGGQANQAFDAIGDSSQTASAQLRTLANRVLVIKQSYDSLATALESVNTGHAFDAAITQIREASRIQGDLAQNLADTADSIDAGVSDSATRRQQVADLIAQAKQGINAAKTDYNGDLTSSVGQLKQSLAQVSGSAQTISSDLDATMASLSDATDSLSARLASAQEQLDQAAKELDGSADYLKEVKEKLSDALASGDVDKIKAIIDGDTTSLADYLASPISMERQGIFPVENNGSSMSSFYTMLTLWVGAVILVVMLEGHLTESRRAQYPKLKPREEFFGRFGIFSLLGLGQSLVVCLGDLFFLKIQCVHPVLFVLAGVLIGQMFCFFIYTLVVSFGNAGKAISVILLVMQVAGSGGIFPIEMSDTIFQDIYPWLPFVHGMRAMQSCVAGIYGMEYVSGLLAVSSLVTLSLLLGLIIRKPIAQSNQMLRRKLEETKLM